MSITTKETLYISDIAITSRKLDGYINATQLCKAGNRLFNTYFRRKKTKEFLEEFSEETQICGGSLIKYNGAHGSERATWVHPQIAINIAQWVSPSFDIKVSRWVYELMLFGDVKLGQERSNKELETKLKESNNMIEILNEKLSTMSIEYKKLKKTHRGLLKHKSVHYFKKGKCFYIISNTQENSQRVKIGISTDINTRLRTHRTAIPYIKLHYLVFLNEYDLLEKIMKSHYSSNLDPNNHEFISGVEIDVIKNKTQECIKLINANNTEILEDELQKYNVDTNTDEVNDIVMEDDMNKKLDEVAFYEETNVSDETKILKEDIIEKEQYIKRCAGKSHETEDDKMLDSSNFHKNRATKDGFSSYCKECATKSRCKNKEYLEKKELEYDRKLFKYCPGKTHSCAKDRIVSLDNFHNNNSAKDGKSAYCKECTGVIKYGEKRKKRIIIYASPPDDIDNDTNKWCQICEKVLERKNFHNSLTSKDGLQNGCKICRANKRHK